MNENPLPNELVIAEKIGRAFELHQANRLAEAAAGYQEILNLQPYHYDALHLSGLLCKSQGRVEDSISYIRQAIQVDASHADAHFNLGGLYLLSARHEQALQCFSQAVSLQPDYLPAINNQAEVLRLFERYEQALAIIEHLIQLKPDYQIAYQTQGAILFGLARYEDAADSYQKAIALKANDVTAYLNLGAVQTKLHRLSEALRSYETAAELKPDCAEAYLNQGVAHKAMRQFDAALRCYDKAIALKPNYAEAYSNKGISFESLKQMSEALACYDQAIALKADYANAWSNRGNVLRSFGDYDEAIGSYENALRFSSGALGARFSLAIGRIPTFSVSHEQEHKARSAFRQEIEALSDWVSLNHPAEGADAVGSLQPFYLAYQEQDNKALLASYGELCVQLMQPFQAEIDQIPMTHVQSTNARKIRLGIVSAHLSNHSVWHAILKGWYQALNKSVFEIHSIYTGTTDDQQTTIAKAESASFYQASNNLGVTIQAIKRIKPDVLIYPEIGMDVMTTKLACLRLAPVQMATWGHPETTGLPTMDYYLSAESFEAEKSDDYYSEQLIRLPNLGCYYTPVEIASIDISLDGLGLDANRPILICAGVPYKYSARYDEILIEIAKKLSDCQFVFFRSDIRDKISDKLQQRLTQSFDRHKLDAEKFVYFIPWQSSAGFYSLMRQADVYLDTIGFSGFNTAVKALECKLPVVTIKGRFMRGRLASGTLEVMGVTETITHDVGEYVECAVKLVQDEQFNQSIRRKIEASISRVYRDVAVIRALERQLLDAVMKSNPGLKLPKTAGKIQQG